MIYSNILFYANFAEIYQNSTFFAGFLVLIVYGYFVLLETLFNTVILTAFCIIARCCSDEEVSQELSESLLEQLKPVQYSLDDFGLNATCSICLGEYRQNDYVIILPCDARHHFHADCIKEWLRQKNGCPSCRKAVTSEALQKFSVSKMLKVLKNNK